MADIINVGNITDFIIAQFREQANSPESRQLVQHLLRTAALAEEYGAAPSLVAAALLHGVGRMLPGQGGDDASAAAVALLGRYFVAAVIEPIRLLGAARLYLSAIEPAYANRLSLEEHGGMLGEFDTQGFITLAFSREAVALCRYSDQAALSVVEMPDPERFRPYLEAGLVTSVVPVVMVMIDGLRPDALRIGKTPNLDAFRARASFAANSRSVMPSVTLPCHMSIFHSVPPARHGIVSNDWAPPARPLPGLVEIASGAGKRCAFFYNWEPLRNLSRPDHLSISYFRNNYTEPGGDHVIADLAGPTIAADRPDFAFVYLGTVDTAGHYYGWMSDGYLEQVQRVDDAFRLLLDHIPTSSHILVLSDHGGHERSHGTDLPEDMNNVWMLAGPGIRQGFIVEREVTLLDTAPTLARLLQVAPHRDWEGRAVEELFVQPVGAR